MKKLALAALAASAFAATPAFANSQNTVIYANVPLVCQITAPGNNGSINLNGSTPIGDVTAQCNNAAGFTASLSSLNGFKLKDQGNASNTTTYAYSVTVAGVGTINTNQSLNINPGPAETLSPLAFGVTINTSGPTGLPYAGTYQDTLTWTLTAN